MSLHSWSRSFILIFSAGLLNLAFINCSNVNSSQSTVSSSLDETKACTLAPSHLRNPTSIDQVTELVNALPKPLSIACLIENLPTPLKVFAVNSSFSAQPSVGANNPRIFIINGNLVMSVVPAGVGRDHIEFGQVINSSESVKAQLTFPITDVIPPSLPYEEAKSGSGTSCRVCHGAERAVSGFGGTAFASGMLQPDPFAQQTSSRLRGLALNCTENSDQFRCQILNAIFVKGRAQDSTMP